jgi:hypothetical protein
VLAAPFRSRLGRKPPAAPLSPEAGRPHRGAAPHGPVLAPPPLRFRFASPPLGPALAGGLARARRVCILPERGPVLPDASHRRPRGRPKPPRPVAAALSGAPPGGSARRWQARRARTPRPYGRAPAPRPAARRCARTGTPLARIPAHLTHVPARGTLNPAKIPTLSRGRHRSPAEGPVSRILSCAVIPLGAALPRTLISDLPGGFGRIIGAALRHRADAGRELCSGLAAPSLFGLAPCGVYHASAITAGAVRSYRTFSPLPPTQEQSQGLLRAVAVCFLWHWPSTGPVPKVDARVPDVIRHTALWSSDFPPPAALAGSGSDRPVLLPILILPRIALRSPPPACRAISCTRRTLAAILLTDRNLSGWSGFSG